MFYLGELVFILPLLHRDIHPDGLPPGYTIILMFRLLPDSPKEAFDIWQVSDKNDKPETGVTIDRKFAVTHSLFSENGKTVEETKESHQLSSSCSFMRFLPFLFGSTVQKELLNGSNPSGLSLVFRGS